MQRSDVEIRNFANSQFCKFSKFANLQTQGSEMLFLGDRLLEVDGFKVLLSRSLPRERKRDSPYLPPSLPLFPSPSRPLLLLSLFPILSPPHPTPPHPTPPPLGEPLQKWPELPGREYLKHNNPKPSIVTSEPGAWEGSD
jgi:hypothetical protein